jgi:Helix-turn-helix domain
MICSVFRLWLPTETDSFASTTLRSSWYTQTTTHYPSLPPPLPTNSLKVSSQFTACKTDIQQKTDNIESTSSNSSNSKGKRKVGECLNFARKKKKVEGLMRSLKIRMYPDAKQKIIMKQWLGCAR